jgi:hypothetical protein
MADPSVVNTALVLERTFGPVDGFPSVWAAAGDHIIATPSNPLHHIRLRWISVYPDPSNATPCLVTIKWSGVTGNIYLIPFPAGPSAFQHRSIREGIAGEDLLINLSAPVTIYVAGLDVEEF